MLIAFFFNIILHFAMVAMVIGSWEDFRLHFLKSFMINTLVIVLGFFFALQRYIAALIITRAHWLPLMLQVPPTASINRSVHTLPY